VLKTRLARVKRTVDIIDLILQDPGGVVVILQKTILKQDFI